MSSIKKVRKVSLWFIGMAVLTIVQFGALYQLDDFLAPPSLEGERVSAAGMESGEKKRLTVPDDAVRYDMTSDSLHLAYVTGEDESKLIIEDRSGRDSLEEDGNITYMKWLGQSNALLYMVEKRRGQELRLMQRSHDEPVPVYKWPDKEGKIEDIYFSPYLEFFYVHMKNEEKDELYKYTASNGLQKLQIGKVHIASIDYDEKNDILYISNSKGKLWEYKDGSIRRSSLKVQKFS